MLLLLGWAAGQPRSARPLPRALAVLAAAALPGLLLSIWLMTPVAPAQDWDLMSVLLLPAAVFAVAASRRLWEGPPRARVAAALISISLVSLLSFVLVNASRATAPSTNHGRQIVTSLPAFCSGDI